MPSVGKFFSGVVLKKATKDDVEAIAQIHIASWKETYHPFFPKSYLEKLSLEEKITQWTSYFKTSDQDDFSVYMAFHEQTPVGFISFGPSRDRDLAKDGEIYALYLSPSHWGMGIGYNLFCTAHQEMLSNGATGTHLWALEENSQALCAYKRWGGKISSHSKRTFILEQNKYREVLVMFAP
ncbi:MAG: GNAT family N-acetyltransferase [Alphaproteobacteria bacterium]|jgi:GNAT superfamily N-acetyltransferase|nr:GNAT family N-acetyltransferase [Alphaproteobacteria bacterium]